MKTSLPWVYCAGKIEKNGWRHDLVPDLRGAQHGVPIRQATFTYCGPYFVSCDHGCAHMNGKHAMATPLCIGRDEFQGHAEPEEVPRLCQQWLQRANLVFAWINRGDCHGTLIELGWAQTLGIPSYVGFANERLRKEMWFLTNCPKTFSRVHTNPRTAFEQAILLAATWQNK